jgi:SAM-dependent methyltransferase
VSGVPFDRAVDFYDATRGLPAEAREAVADLLVAELRGRRRCLEIGVGTGRIAVPLHQRGVSLLGVDLSGPMLARLVANAGGVAPFPLVIGDALALPWPDGAVEAVLVSHVLHLIADWHAAIDEMVRVVGPDGVLLVDFGGGLPAPWSAPARLILRQHGISDTRPGVNDARLVADYLTGRTEVRALRPVIIHLRRSLAFDLDEWEHQLHAWTWNYSAAQMAAGCAAVREWAVAAGWPLDQQLDLIRPLQWWAFRVTRRPSPR